MIGLRDPSACPVFQCYDPATDSLDNITYPDGLQPRRINNYILDPADWQPTSHTRKYKRSNSKTRAAVLAHGVDDEQPCLVCGRKGARCFGESCVRSFRRRVEETARAGKLRIERAAAGDVGAAPLGYGVFAGAGIRKGDMVGEYLGRLHPPGGPRLAGGHAYAFELDSIAMVDAREYGSVGALVLFRWSRWLPRPSLVVSSRAGG